MKRVLIFSAAALLLSSCNTYTGSGAYAGATLGTMLGSAIGGIVGGPHGSDVGTIVGMAGGAFVGASIGSEADAEKEADMQQYYRDRAERRQQSRTSSNSQQRNYYGEGKTQKNQYGNGSPEDYEIPDDSGFDPTGSGDDRLYDFGSSDYTGNYSADSPTTTMPGKSSVEQISSAYDYSPAIVVNNARFVDADRDGTISRGETCKVIFEIYNRGTSTVHDVEPMVVEASNNRHIFISPSVHVESIEPGKGIRYTAMVKASDRLKDGTARICVSVLQGGKAMSKVSEFDIPTRK